MIPVVLFLAASLRPATEGAPPYRQPQLAAAHGQVALVFGSAGTLYFSRSADRGRSFAEPVAVATVGALALGRHRGPRLTILRDALVVTAIAGERVATGPHAHGLPDQGDLLVWRSTDGGSTWKRTATINDAPGAAREGLHAIAARPDGRLTAVWLDLRSKSTQLWGAHSSDGGITWSANERLYASPAGTICQCCHPTLASDEAGEIWMMWRNVLEGARDLYAMNTRDRAARKLGTGTWKLNACPMDGGGFVVSQGRITSAWQREGEVILARPDGERRLGRGKDVAVARDPRTGGVTVAWSSEGGIRVLGPNDAAPRVPGEEGAFVHLVPLEEGGGVLAAWESKGGIATARIE